MYTFLVYKFPDKQSKWEKWGLQLADLDIDTVGDLLEIYDDVWKAVTISPVLNSGLLDLRRTHTDTATDRDTNDVYRKLGMLPLPFQLLSL